MMPMHVLLLLAFLQAPAAGEPLRSGCSSADEQIAVVAAGDSVQIQMALGGEEKTCYKLRVTTSGETLTGYVLGEGLPAIAEFVWHRQKASVEAAEAEARRALLPPVQPVANDLAKPPADPLISTQFEDFSGRDPSGKVVSLSGLKGRVVLVTFWSPKSATSIGHLSSVQVLYQQLHSAGLAAVGVSADPNPYHITEALDDAILTWPQIPDRTGLAAHYHVEGKAGKTFVLDSSHRIVASGTMGPELEKTVRDLLAAK
jgi:peroxiredoxin